jgi:hypothetical protein
LPRKENIPSNQEQERSGLQRTKKLCAVNQKQRTFCMERNRRCIVSQEQRTFFGQKKYTFGMPSTTIPTVRTRNLLLPGTGDMSSATVDSLFVSGNSETVCQ